MTHFVIIIVVFMVRQSLISLFLAFVKRISPVVVIFYLFYDRTISKATHNIPLASRMKRMWDHQKQLRIGKLLRPALWC